MKAHVTAHSQPYRLRERIAQADIRHGQEVRADLPGVRVGAIVGSWFNFINRKPEGEVFFCNMGPIKVREILQKGDDLPLPNQVIVEGLDVEDSGTYDIINALVRSNGDLRLVVDDKTRIVPAEREFHGVYA
jgi:hypothetical protein